MQDTPSVALPFSALDGIRNDLLIFDKSTPSSASKRMDSAVGSAPLRSPTSAYPSIQLQSISGRSISGPAAQAASLVPHKQSDLSAVVTFPITCQTFFQRHVFLRYFPVQLATGTNSEAQDSSDKPKEGIQALSILEWIKLQLDQKLSALDPGPAPHRPGQQHFSQVSAWLETTQWTSYLQGHDLRQATALIELHLSTAATRQAALDEQESRSTDQLRLLLDSFDRVIEQARNSLLEDRINVFD
ncbi:hypothetical protein G7Y89_g14715 [Cudoniella acicularis]|uniref:Uncharacterized protein n=1 Tax=Cudoniella acicularis TaxID=354080 RepID=A0A8H4R0P3_9HELO|nr:hypothetical protein G7Y89_g14715 [Cudoniella acicularis]